jgi:hypothetical protein
VVEVSYDKIEKTLALRVVGNSRRVLRMQRGRLGL